MVYKKTNLKYLFMPEILSNTHDLKQKIQTFLTGNNELV